ncbi:hypothetical protein [Desulfatirhabdium butyrativorans]|uniref:hypothetical protein n=1 Tax=Desulfatirhabdium butyrativorans TaxID=340467 RepID=UPI0012ECA735|nr:hypothetical protein [Desulfatirhabdium butyrativorans]
MSERESTPEGRKKGERYDAMDGEIHFVAVCSGSDRVVAFHKTPVDGLSSRKKNRKKNNGRATFAETPNGFRSNSLT